MMVKYLAHAAFLITSSDKKRIITDPYTTGNGLNYAPINETAEIVTRSHAHGDHNNTKIVKGSPVVLTEPVAKTIQGIAVRTVSAFHDEAGGSKRGNDLVFCFEVDGMHLCHLGDLGHRLSPQQVSDIGPLDLLFIPVGGFFTIDAAEATVVMQSLKPRIVFPMHYKTGKSDYPIAGVEDFLKNKKNVRRFDSSEVEIKQSDWTEETQIYVLKPQNCT